MFLVFIFFACFYLYGVDDESAKDKMPPVSLLEPIRLAFFDLKECSTDAAETSITSSAGVSVDEEVASLDDEPDDEDYALFRLLSRADSYDFDDLDLTDLVPLYADETSGRVTEENTLITLPPKRTRLEIQFAKDAYRQAVSQIRAKTRERSIEILMLRLTGPQRH